MKTTVVIPNYNGEKYMENCLLHLINAKMTNTNHDFQILVVDNGSSDVSYSCCVSYANNNIIKLIRLEENTGFCHAVNVGIDASETEYVILLNNDTAVDVDFVIELEKFMDEHPDAFSASSKMISMWANDIIDDCGDLYCALGWAFGLGKGEKTSKYEKVAKVFAACGGAAIYRKEVFDKIGKFDENHFAYLEDIDIGYRAKIHGFRNYFCPTAKVEHAGSAVSGSRYNAFKTDLSAKNSIYIIYKNMPLLQIIINSPFLLLGFLIKILFFSLKGLGIQYVKGLGHGFALCASSEGKSNKVHFLVKNMSNYCKIQLELWINIVRRLIG